MAAHERPDEQSPHPTGPALRVQLRQQVHVLRPLVPSSGRYQFWLHDKNGDGFCSENKAYGCWYLRLFLNGQNVGRMINDKSNFSQKDFPFIVGISSPIDGTPSKPSPNLGEYCGKVASRIKVPQGTCTLPNGRRGHRVQVTTKVDKYGKETSWQIKAVSGNVVKMKMGPVVEPNQQNRLAEEKEKGLATDEAFSNGYDKLCSARSHHQGTFLSLLLSKAGLRCHRALLRLGNDSALPNAPKNRSVDECLPPACRPIFLRPKTPPDR